MTLLRGRRRRASEVYPSSTWFLRCISTLLFWLLVVSYCSMRNPLGISAVLFLLCVSSSGCATGFHLGYPKLPRSAIRPVVAVSSFDNKSGFEGQWKLGSGMADLLVSELVTSENFVVVERQHLERVVGEIARQKNKNLFRTEGTITQGRLMNARYLIRGTIADFSQVSSVSFWAGIRQFLFGAKSHKARVAMALTIVDVQTGRIIDSVQGAGNARAGEVYLKGSYRGVSFGGDAFFKTPLGSATREAIRKGVRGIIRRMPRVTWQLMIADVGRNGIILNGGSTRGIRKGMQFNVRGAGKPVTDPVTGDLLDIIPGRIVGVVRVVSATPKIARVEAVRGSVFVRGQMLEEVTARASR